MLDGGTHDDAHFAALWQTITQSEIWHGNFVNRRKDGTLYEEEATISPIRDGSGTIVNFIALKRDVTQEVALAGSSFARHRRWKRSDARRRRGARLQQPAAGDAHPRRARPWPARDAAADGATIAELEASRSGAERR